MAGLFQGIRRLEPEDYHSLDSSLQAILKCTRNFVRHKKKTESKSNLRGICERCQKLDLSSRCKRIVEVNKSLTDLTKSEVSCFFLRTF